jgi:hypothetical protein
VLNGAGTTPAVDTALASAEAYFTASGSGLTRSQVIALAGVLASYNEGDIGPGHCDQ